MIALRLDPLLLSCNMHWLIIGPQNFCRPSLDICHSPNVSILYTKNYINYHHVHDVGLNNCVTVSILWTISIIHNNIKAKFSCINWTWQIETHQSCLWSLKLATVCIIGYHILDFQFLKAALICKIFQYYQSGASDIKHSFSQIFLPLLSLILTITSA